MTARQDDRILEGVKAAELVSLSAIARGEVAVRSGDLAPLFAKGWVELAGDQPIITLTGRTLLDHPPIRLR